MELTLESIGSFLEKNEAFTHSVEFPSNPLYSQRVDYEPKNKVFGGTRPSVERRERRGEVRTEARSEARTEARSEVPPPEPPKVSRGKTLWEALLPYVDGTAPLFTETMKQEATALVFQTMRDTLMGDWGNRCGKPSSVRACLKAMDQGEFKVAIDSVSWSVLATLFHYMWNCNILLKEKQKEVVKGFECSETLKIEHTKTEWLVSKI